MSSESTDFRVYQGNDRDVRITVRNPLTKVAVDITDATIQWRAVTTLKKTVAISKSTSSGISITDGEAGQFTVTLSNTDTALDPGDYYHEAEVTFTDTKVGTVIRGIMTIDPTLI